MRQQKPLPTQLARRSFSVPEARSLGLKREDIRRRDLLTASRGIRVPWGISQELSAILSPLLQLTPGAVVSHNTAAKLWGLPLPPRVAADRRLHLAKVHDSTTTLRFGVRGHRLKLLPNEITIHLGIRTTSPARTWLDLASTLQIDELVAFGDAIVCSHRRSFGPEKLALADLPELQQIVLAHRGHRGLLAAKQALQLIRVGSDSPPESFLRLAGLDLGLPEPELSFVIINSQGEEVAWPDLAYPKYRVSVQYDGRHHLSSGQLAHDAKRDNETARVGWISVRIDRRMIRDLGYHGAMRYVRQFLLQRGWTPVQK